MKRLFACAVFAAALAGCYREQRPPQAPQAASRVPGGSPDPASGRLRDAAPLDAALPIAARPAARTAASLPSLEHYQENAYAVSQGKRLYRAYNCNGCHAQGGGDIGPALMDAKWRYGADPKSIFETIAHGRPRGMPAFGEHVPAEQIWQITAYVRSLSGQLRSDVAPSRSDTVTASEPETRREKQTPKPDVPPEPEKREP